jgi:hypothetical protein
MRELSPLPQPVLVVLFLEAWREVLKVLFATTN